MAFERAPCPKCGTPELVERDENSPDWVIQYGIRSVTVQYCSECDYVGFEGFHPKQTFPVVIRQYLQHLGAFIRAYGEE